MLPKEVFSFLPLSRKTWELYLKTKTICTLYRAVFCALKNIDTQYIDLMHNSSNSLKKVSSMTKMEEHLSKIPVDKSVYFRVGLLIDDL